MTSSERPTRYRHIVFDLDDTLLDTSRLLIPVASREALEKMISEGLGADLPQALNAWSELTRSPDRRPDHNRRRQDIFTQLADRFGASDAARVARLGSEAFYNRKVESHITLFPGAREMIDSLRKKYSLHLVTAGNSTTQKDKIEILNLGPLFESLSTVDSARGQTKGLAFMQIAKNGGGRANQYLSVGNRIDIDILEAKQIGWDTCWVKYGEHASLLPLQASEQPDYTVDNVVEIVDKCQL